MARRKSARGKLTKAQRTLQFTLPNGFSYLDSAQALSITNRKLFKQNRCYGIESVEFKFRANPALYDSIEVTANVAGDTWVVHNSHVKGEALWHEMNELVLEDNPSIKGKWADYKVFLNTEHRAQFFTIGNLMPQASSGVPFLAGEWNYSDYVLPQHEVDPATGLPLPADQTQAHLVGPTLGGPGGYQSVGLIDSYQESRATVQPNDPNVPPGVSTSFFNLLTDSGSQEPELADVIIAENDAPPYDTDNYPSGAVNGPGTVQAEFGIASASYPLGQLTSFVAQCGLVKFFTRAFKDGVAVDAPDMDVLVTYMAGTYKGIAAISMGQ